MTGLVISVCLFFILICAALLRYNTTIEADNKSLQDEILSQQKQLWNVNKQRVSLESENKQLQDKICSYKKQIDASNKQFTAFEKEKQDFEDYKAHEELLLTRKKDHFADYKAREEDALQQRWNEWFDDKISFSNDIERREAKLAAKLHDIEENSTVKAHTSTDAKAQEHDLLAVRYHQLIWRLTETCRNLDNDYIAFNNAKADLNRRYKEFDDRYALYNKFIINQLQAFFKNSSAYKLLSGSMVHTHLASGFTLGYNRLYHYIHDETHGVYHELRSLKVEGEIVSNSNTYHTTLYSCTCPDFKNNLKGSEPCKHMYMLAFEIGLLNDLPKHKIISDLKEASEIYKDIVLKEQALRASQNQKPEE